jgi:hypothetical protein
MQFKTRREGRFLRMSTAHARAVAARIASGANMVSEVRGVSIRYTRAEHMRA